MACTLDFRFLDEGVGGTYFNPKKRSREDAFPPSSVMEVDNPTSSPTRKRANGTCGGGATYDGVIAGRVSGRNWKQPRKQRSGAMKVSLKRSTFEERVKEKEIKKAYKERMAELKEEIRSNKIEKRKRREEREKKKEENILKSGLKLQKISNPNTIKKIARSKHRKLLKVVPD